MRMVRRFSPLLPPLAATVAGFALAGAACGATGSTEPRPRAVSTAAPARAAHGGGVHHYEYVLPDQSVYVYDIDHGQRLVQHISLPAARGIRGVVADIAEHALFISHGGDADTDRGSLMKVDLLTGRVLWDRSYPHGIDSMAASRDGSRLYMPSGENSQNGLWYVLSASTGEQIGQIDSGGRGPHNTVVGASGKRVFMGPRNDAHLVVADTATNRVTMRIGPLVSGVRPFTINGKETLAYTEATGFLGFQVSDLVRGRVLYTVRLPSRFGPDPSFTSSAPSHGISLSPNGRQLWVMDGANSYVHVYDVSQVPRRPPRHVADIRLSRPIRGNEEPCSYDCVRSGWLQHSRDGRFVYAGDSGDVISTRTRRIVAFLPALYNTRKHLEIDWRDGRPVSTTTRIGLGH